MKAPVTAILAISLAAAAALLMLPLPAGAVAKARPLPVIRVHGNHLVAGGRVVQLRGVNETGTEYECMDDNASAFDRPQDRAATFRQMRSWGIDAVRVPLNEDCWLGVNHPAYGKTRYQTAIRAYVAHLIANRFWPVLNLHFSAPGTQRAEDQSPMADASHSVAFWASIGRAFRHANVLFDLFNEPHGVSWRCIRDGGACAGLGYRAAGMQAILTALRRAGARTQPVLVAGPDWAGLLSQWVRWLPRDPSHALVASIHIYSNPPDSPCNRASCWNGQVARVAARNPVIAGEFGCRPSLARALTRWADRHGVSYLAWAWDDGDNCGGGPALLRTFATAAPTSFGAAVRAHYRARLRHG